MSKTGKVRDIATKVQDNAAMRAAARVGFVVNGLLHVLIGLIAVEVAFGTGGEADTGGAMSQVAATPGGLAVLWAVLVGLWGLAAFQLLETALVTGVDKDSWGARAKEGGKAIAYAFVGATALSFIVGRSPDSGDQATGFSAQLLSSPGGVLALLLVATMVAAVGVYFVAKGIRQHFLHDLNLPGGTTRRVTVVIGTGGYVAKGIAVVVVGILFGLAALSADASEATGLDGALKALAALPFGTVVLSVIALGLVSYGVYCFVRAVHARL
ncbi:DUF1206 domain-containing protein [Homoserinimonas sp. A520]